VSIFYNQKIMQRACTLVEKYQSLN